MKYAALQITFSLWHPKTPKKTGQIAMDDIERWAANVLSESCLQKYKKLHF